MKKKDEKMADLGLKQLGVDPQIYHFVLDVAPFTAITIAENCYSRLEVRELLDDVIYNIIPLETHEKATRLRIELIQRGIYGVGIGDARDQLNRPLGRTIAKGRLLKHLISNRGGRK